MISENKLKYIIILAGSVFMIIFCIIPFVFMLLVSFNVSPDFLSAGTAMQFTTENYRAVIATPSLHFIEYLRNSLIISGTSAFVCVLIAGMAAYSITRLSFPFKSFILFFVLAVSMFPQISLVSFLFKFMTGLGWTNTYHALIFPYVAWILPLSLWILVSYFMQIPLDLDRAALVDGCSRLQILRRIIFPVAAPGLFSTSLLAFIFAFNEFLFALVLTTDYRSRTVPVGIAFFQGLHGEIPWGNIMAASTLTIIPVVVLTLIFQRRIIQGLTRGAVKG